MIARSLLSDRCIQVGFEKKTGFDPGTAGESMPSTGFFERKSFRA